MNRLRPWLPFFFVLAVLLAVYLPVLQTIPNGADHYTMIDVGETQVVLNVWGTLHATGYPHYVITGSALTALFRLAGAPPALAPALVSLFWGVLALALAYRLATHFTQKPTIAALVILLFGVTRTVWIHQVIAEIYTFGLFLLVLLLALALWRRPIPGRIYWLALVGGIGVAHHRAIVMVAPALLYAVWPQLKAEPRRLPRRIGVSVMLGLLGFVPYAYLPLREWAGAAWVYGEPGTWLGFWDQFWGTEASRFVGFPASLDALLANVALVNGVLLTDLTLPGLLLGLAGLGVGLRRHRRAVVTFILTGLVAYGFHVLVYTDILSALILPVELSLAFGWLFLLDFAVERTAPARARLATGVAVGLAALFAVMFVAQNLPFIRGLTNDPTGLEAIAQARSAPPGSTLMIAWGPRHFAVGFARDVLGELQAIRLVDHKADFRALLDAGPLVTPEYTFYNQPVEWWQAQLGSPVYLQAAAPGLVQIQTQPELATTMPDGPVDAIREALTCTRDSLVLDVTWAAAETPEENLSVFVHLLDSTDALIAQADQSAPVSGWRPLTTWTSGEAVRDIYALPRAPNAAAVRYGLYRSLPDGGFENMLERRLPVTCDE